MAPPRLLFISYCKTDKEWLDRIRQKFAARTNPALLDIWDDRLLHPGEDFRKAILSAIAKSNVALLVVSESFHKSSFIRDVEVPVLQDAYHDGRIQLTWVRIDEADFGMRAYSQLQAAIPPVPALQTLAQVAQDEKLDQLVETLIQLLIGLQPSGSETVGTRAGDGGFGASSYRKGRFALGAIAVLMLLCWGFATFASAARPDRTALLQFLHGHHWIGYEPARFHPDRTDNVSVSEIETELLEIRRAGFTGIVTFGARPDLARIPALAQEQGLSVIMGVWNPLDQDELRAAYEQRDAVQAYCVGHNCLGDDRGRSLCTERDLERAIRWLRRHTGKPVTTTQLGKYYQTTSSRLNLMGDFLCPDLHHNYRYADLAEDVRITSAEIERIAQIAEQYDRPFVLKTMAYPVQITADAEPDYQKQQDYYTQVLMATRDPLTGPRAPVAFVLHSAFDEPWKQGSVFLPWDPYTGLFDRNGRPRPVVEQWMWLKR